MKTLRVMACVLTLGAALAYSGCGSDYGPPVKVPVSKPDAGTDAGTEVTTFVRDLILNQTSDTGLPVTTEDKNLVDSEPADAFPASFFQ